MDYETITISGEVNPKISACGCWLKTSNMEWEYGEIVETALTLCGEMIADDNLITGADFLYGSNTKYLRVTLTNFRGEIINTQKLLANELDYTIKPDSNPETRDKAVGYYRLSQELSKSLKPGSYYLFVSLVNTLPALGSLPERTLFDKDLSGREGITITIN